MATSLSELRKTRASMFDKITKDLDSGNQSQNKTEDNRFWKLTRDKTGNGSAVIRFLSPVNGDELPWVRVYSHAFQGPSGKWYINNSLTTLGQADPVSESNRELWATGIPENQELVRKRKRKTQYISNILVIKDPANPENEGKVFLFQYGKKIHDMITAKAKPEFDDETPVYVWDLWDGANFKLRIKTVSDYPNYDSSTFDSPSELFDGDEDDLQKVVDSCYKLSEFVDPSKFKSYDALKKEFDRAVGLSGDMPVRSALEQAQEDVSENVTSKAPIKVQKVEKRAEAKTTKVESSGDDGDSDLDYFKKLLEDI